MDSATIVGLVIIAVLVIIALAYYVFLRRAGVGAVMERSGSRPNSVLMNEPVHWGITDEPYVARISGTRSPYPDEKYSGRNSPVYASVFGGEH